MGAVPERIGPLAGTSPAHELDYLTEPIRAHTAKPGPRKFTRVPTHAVGVAHERRRYPRASLCLPLTLTRIEGVAEPIPVTLVTRNISSSGVYFLAPRDLKPGAAIELEVALVERPLGFGRVEMCTAAHIVRTDDTDTPGWRGYAASFDDFEMKRDDVIPLRYQTA
jgi:hypothetical protein